MIINCVLSLRKFVLVVHVTLVKPSAMQKLDGINIIIQLNVQDHQNTLNAKSSTALHGLSFQMLQKMQRPGIASKPHIFFSENLILNEEKDFERLDLFRNGVT